MLFRSGAESGWRDMISVWGGQGASGVYCVAVPHTIKDLRGFFAENLGGLYWRLGARASRPHDVGADLAAALGAPTSPSACRRGGPCGRPCYAGTITRAGTGACPHTRNHPRFVGVDLYVSPAY